MKNAQFTRAFDGAKDDDSCIPRFFLEAEPIMVDGKTVYQDREFIEITIPGDNTKKPVFPVSQTYIDRWPNAYKKFKEGLEAPIDGRPLEEWPILRPAMVLQLKSLGFRTVENVANMSDIAVQKVGIGALELRKKAQAYLNEADAAAITNEAIERAEKWERRAGDLEAQLARTNHDLATFGERMRQMEMNAHLRDQNIATAGLREQPMQSLGEPPGQVSSPLAAFASAPARDSAMATDLSEFNETRKAAPYAPPAPPRGETVTVAPAQPQKRRGRPSKADMAAREEMEEAHG